MKHLIRKQNKLLGVINLDERFGLARAEERRNIIEYFFNDEQ